MDDGTRLVRVLGCEYRLSESEITNWLSHFGEVLSEISEESFQNDGLDPDLPPVGNGIYLVKMKLTRSLPNWVPMYGRKICFDYPGVKKQCTNCYGAHAKRYCRSERVGMENFVRGFSEIYSFIPCDLYGRLAGLASNQATRPPPVDCNPSNEKASHTGVQLPNAIVPQNSVHTLNKSNVALVKDPARPNLRISLRRENGNDWSSSAADPVPNVTSSQGSKPRAALF